MEPKPKTKKKKRDTFLPPVTYYDDELNDEFSKAQITPKTVGDDYVYFHKSFFKRLTHFFWYRIVATPAAVVWLHFKFRHKIVGRQKLRPYRKKGYFLYGNHTQDVADALIPSMISFPTDAYVIVHPNNVSMPFLGRVTPSMGALPLPDTIPAARNFYKAVVTRFTEGNAVVIYPEAHIWPYYTGIRPFPDTSFQYPVRLDAPVFCFTNTYLPRGKSLRRVRIVTYVDGPFFADPSLSPAERRRDLRERVLAQMRERSQLNSVVAIEYRPRRTKTADNAADETENQTVIDTIDTKEEGGTDA